MTREEFMKHAREEIDRAFAGHRNRLMNLVEQAWAEGKKNAEAGQVEAILREAIKRFEPPETASAEPEKCSCWHAIPTGLKREEGTFEYRCWGTPERDICTCGGDKSKCDFYGGCNHDA